MENTSAETTRQNSLTHKRNLYGFFLLVLL